MGRGGGGQGSDDSKGMWDQWRWQSVERMHLNTVSDTLTRGEPHPVQYQGLAGIKMGPRGLQR